MDPEVVHGHGRKAGHEALPRPSAIHGHVRADIRADEKQVRVMRVFANHVNEVGPAGGQVGGDGTEGLSGVAGGEDVRGEVAVAVVVERDVERRRVAPRRFDATHIRSRRDARKATGQVFPASTVIAGHPDAAVIGAGVQDSWPHRRFVQRHDGAIRLGACRIGRYAAGGHRRYADLHRVGVGEFRRDQEHVVAAPGGLEHTIGAEVQRARVVPRDEKRRVPVPAKVEPDGIRALAGANVGDAAFLLWCLRLRRVRALDEDRILELVVAPTPLRLHQARAFTRREVDPRDIPAL